MTYGEGEANFGELHVGNMLEHLDKNQATRPWLHEEQSVCSWWSQLVSETIEADKGGECGIQKPTLVVAKPALLYRPPPRSTLMQTMRSQQTSKANRMLKKGNV